MKRVYVKAVSTASAFEEGPDFRRFLSPMAARRLDAQLKRVVATARTALSTSGLTEVDAIIYGTAWGAVENTEHFLRALRGGGDEPLRPTHFMQSTHNTMASLVAIGLHAHGYNASYSQGAISFESALFDAFLQLQSGEIRTALVGASEEILPGSEARTPVAAAVVLSTAPEGALAEVGDVQLGASELSAACILDRSEMIRRSAPSPCVSALAFCDAVREGLNEALLLRNEANAFDRARILLLPV